MTQLFQLNSNSLLPSVGMNFISSTVVSWVLALPFPLSSAVAFPGRCCRCRWRRTAVTPARSSRPAPSAPSFSSSRCPSSKHTEEGRKTCVHKHTKGIFISNTNKKEITRRKWSQKRSHCFVFVLYINIKAIKYKLWNYNVQHVLLQHLTWIK